MKEIPEKTASKKFTNAKLATANSILGNAKGSLCEAKDAYTAPKAVGLVPVIAIRKALAA